MIGYAIYYHGNTSKQPVRHRIDAASAVKAVESFKLGYPGLTYLAIELWEDALEAQGNYPSNAMLAIRAEELMLDPVIKFAPVGPRKLPPALPAEVNRKVPDVDLVDYMAAVRAMCKGGPL